MGAVKAILVHRQSVAGLREFVAGLDALPRRALSLPAPWVKTPAITAFVELWGDVDRLRASIADWPLRASAWLVDESLPADAPRTWRAGEPSPGVRLVGSLHRKPGLDRERFAEHWRTRHLEVSMAFTIPVWRYGQNVVVEALSGFGDADGDGDGHRHGEGDREGDGAIDGFAVLHFRSREDLAARWSRYPEEARRGAEDAARFMRTDRGWSVEMIEVLWDTDDRPA